MHSYQEFSKSTSLLCLGPNRQGHQAMMLSDVCLSHTSGLSRENRFLGTLKLAPR